ncbi:MAG: hypothetical protein ACRDIC_21800 [bacterium]
MVAVLALVSAGWVAAEWKESGKVVPDQPWVKSAGEFGVQLVFTNKPEEHFATSERAVPAVVFSQAATAKRGVMIVGLIYFFGCATDNSGDCDATARFTVYNPEGKRWINPEVKELWVGKPPPPKGQMQLSKAHMGIVVEPGDPLGIYKVKVEVTDKIANKTLVLERTFTAIESDMK